MSEGFQFKLYRLVTEGESGITWSNVGESIYIDIPKFEKFLSRANSFCKSTNVTSFIRQLNLYGFKIVIDLDEDNKHAHNKNLKEYINPHFRRGRFDLLSKITRNGKDIKLKLPTFDVPPLPTQTRSKRKREISKEDQYNPLAKKIKQEVIDDSYHPFGYDNSKIEQIDPAAKKIKQEIIDSSYGDIQSNSPSRAESVCKVQNPEYKEISTSQPLFQRTRHCDKQLISILKPPTAGISKISSPPSSPDVQNETIVQNISGNVDDVEKPTETVSSPPPSPDVQNISGNVDDVQKPTKTITQNSGVAFNSVESQSAKPSPPIQITQNSGVAFNSVESQSAKRAPPIQITQNSGVAFNSVESQSARPAPPIQITQNSCVAFNSVESQSAKPAPPIKITQNSGVAFNSVESQSAKPAPPIQMAVEHKNETNSSPDIDVITLLTEEKFHQMEMECLTKMKVLNVSTNTAISEVFHGEDLDVVEEIVVLNTQDTSESTVDVTENKDHQYARNYIEEITPNMVMQLDQSAVTSLITSENQQMDVTKNYAELNQAIDDEEEDLCLLPWRNRPPSSYVFSNILPRYKSDYEYQCPLLINNQDYALKALQEDKTEPNLKPGSENLLWSSSLYKNREAFRREILDEYFSIEYDKSRIVSNGRGELKPKTLQEVLDYKIKK